MSQKPSQEIRLSLVEKANEVNSSKIQKIKARLSEELQYIEKNIDEIDKIKNDSIDKIETRKKELREIGDSDDICKVHREMLQEIAVTEKDIKERKISISVLDQTVGDLDDQIAQIQVEHDKAVGDLEQKRRKLSERIDYLDLLNEKLEELSKLLEEQTSTFDRKLSLLMRQKSELLKRTDLSETTMKHMLNDIDKELEELNKERENIFNEITQKISDIDIEKGTEEDESDFLTEEQIKDLQRFEAELAAKHYGEMTLEERLHLLRMGLQITPSGRIITKDDKVITLEEARRLGLFSHLYYEYHGEDIYEHYKRIPILPALSEGAEEEEEVFIEKFVEKRIFYPTSSSISSTTQESSTESALAEQDIEYLKQVFGKSLSLALADIVALQPADPIHYLAHWLFKYRYNQEIDEVKRNEIQALMIERERLSAEKWHAELEEEARLAIFEALFRAENIILQQQFERIAMLGEETEGEYEEENPLDMIL